MINTGESVFEAALALPERERAVLIRRLAATLSPEQLDEDEELVGELERRSAEFENGTADPITWAQLRAELMAELDGRDIPSPGEQRSA